METYDSTVKRAGMVNVGDFLIGVDRSGEHLAEVREITRDHGTVVIVTTDQTVTLKARDAVRVAHPDLPLLDVDRSVTQAESS